MRRPEITADLPGPQASKLVQTAKTSESMGDIRGLGRMVGVELVTDRETKERAGELRNNLMA
jgi:4-aminobutyrate aminotransferase-like enzyme